MTTYEATLRVVDSVFADNHTEDTINLVRSTFSIDAVEVVNSSSDAIDIDFGNGTISNSAFSGIGGDAIDISGTSLIAHNNLISNTADKAISIGEKSFFKGSNFTISDVSVGVACKDGSIGTLDDSEIRRARRAAYAAYIKKAEYERPTLEVTATTVEDTDTESIVFTPAEIVIDGTGRASLDINARKILRAGYTIFGNDERISF